MKLNIKAFAFACGILWMLAVIWTVALAMTGNGIAPFNYISQWYLGWITPTILGLVIGAVVGFVDAFIAGAIFAWLYNKCSSCCCKGA
jgi:hypothetical protein